MPQPARPRPPAPWVPYPGNADPSGLSLLVFPSLHSRALRNSRDLLVALPPTYATSERRYPVVYMQDGQNLFDPATSFAGDWHLGRTMADLAAHGVEAIVVGVPNAGRRRIHEYSPFRDSRHGGGGGDTYLRFLADTVKPLIDRSFRTHPGREATAIAGSSMGGLISLYALYRFPSVFGAAGVMSPSLWFARRAMLGYVQRSATIPGRIYLDVGLQEEPTAVADARVLRDILVTAGREPGRDLEYLEDEDGRHAEEAWGRRFARALPFLLGYSRTGPSDSS